MSAREVWLTIITEEATIQRAYVSTTRERALREAVGYIKPKDWEDFFDSCVRSKEVPEGSGLVREIGDCDPEQVLTFYVGEPERTYEGVEDWGEFGFLGVQISRVPLLDDDTPEGGEA